MKKVLLTKKVGEKNLALLEKTAEVLNVPEGDVDALKGLLKDIDAVVLGTSFKFTGEIIDCAPRLKVISRTGVGVDNVDVKAATEKGILVLNTPEANSVSVAEHTVALIAGISKQLVFMDSELRKGNFKARRLEIAADMSGKTLGLVGCGRIGRMVAKKCIAAFDMRAIGYDPYLTDCEGIRMCGSIEEVFRDADYISLHLPFDSSTRNLVGENLLSLMKPDAYLINTARGGIVDEKALAEKLRTNKIAGAALDVFASEPPESTNELLTLPNIILTPHTAALTRECTERVAYEAVKGVVDYLEGKTPKYVFNKEVLKSKG